MAHGKAAAIVLSAEERRIFDDQLRRRTTPQRDVERTRIVLLAADGLNNGTIAKRLGICAHTAGTWRNRFAARGLEGLYDEPRPGTPRTLTEERIAEVVTKTLETLPANATHWSTRSMAQASGVSTTSVHRIWSAFALAPHRSETFKLSTDPLFVEKVRDIVGLYVNPPERAMVLCVDEKSQIQPRIKSGGDRTQVPDLIWDAVVAAGPSGAAHA